MRCLSNCILGFEGPLKILTPNFLNYESYKRMPLAYQSNPCLALELVNFEEILQPLFIIFKDDFENGYFYKQSQKYCSI